MNILHIASSIGSESAGGRLCTALKKQGCSITTLSQMPPAFPDSQYIHPKQYARKLTQLHSRLGKLPFLFYPKRNKKVMWTSHLFGNNIQAVIQKLSPDIIHLHWVAAGTVNLAHLAHIGIPIVWTLHDMWPLTAGCHYSMGCTLWRQGCNDCPQLGKNILGFSYPSYLWKDKLRLIQQNNITAICPSRWIAEMARQSPLWQGHNIVHIGNALDTKVFSPTNQRETRQKLGINEDKKILLFGANGIDSPYKGFDLLLDTLKKIQHRSDIELLVFGAQCSEFSLPCKTTFTGWIDSPQQLAQIYRAADIFVAPSRQDNLPTTLIEASSCGIPCVSFNIGGISDIVVHQKTGYLAQAFDTGDLANGIEWLLDHKHLREEYAYAAREHCVANFEAGDIARQHIELYKTLLSQ